MRKQFHTPDGIIERDLTSEELKDIAQQGDREARIGLIKEKFKKPLTLEERVELLEQLLGIKNWM